MKSNKEESMKNTKGKGEDDLKTAAVLFIENTKEGRLAKNMREVMERIQNILGYRVKVVERAGTPLKLMFPLTKVGESKECGRDDCISCTQESRGEELPPCRKRNIL